MSLFYCELKILDLWARYRFRGIFFPQPINANTTKNNGRRERFGLHDFRPTSVFRPGHSLHLFFEK